MEESKQISIFGKVIGEWVWCSHCQQVSEAGQFRLSPNFQMRCPNWECDGDKVQDSLDWKKMLEYHPEYPEFPEEDTVYPM